MVRLTIRSIWKRKWSFIMIIFVSVVSFIMLSLSIYIYENSVYCKKVITESLNSGTENSGVLYLSGGYFEETGDKNVDKYMNFKRELSSMDGISSSGELRYNGGFEDFTLARRQCELTGRDDGMLNYGYVENTAIDYYKIPLSEGTLVKDMPNDVNINYVYLGSAYKKYYEVGDTITDKLMRLVHEGKKTKKVTENITFIVKGFIKDGTKFVYPETFGSSDAFLNDKCYEVLSSTGVIVEFNSYNTENSVFLSWKKSQSYNALKAKINKLAAKYGFTVLSVSMEKLLNEKEASSREINEYILNILGIVITVTVIMMICIQISAVLNNMSEYGILYANGYTTHNIAMMIILESIIRMAATSIASLYLVKILVWKVFIAVPGESEVFKEIFYKYVISGNIISAVLICAVSVILPLMIIGYKRPVELIGGNDT